MNWFDIFIIAVLSIGILVGFRSGLVRQLFGLISFVASFLIGIFYMEDVGGWFETQFGVSEAYSSLVGFGAVFLVIYLCTMIMSRVFDKIITEIPVIGGLNKIGGAALGLVTTGLLLSLVLLVLNEVDLPSQGLRDSSAFYENIYEILPRTWELATQRFPELTELTERFSLKDSI